MYKIFSIDEKNKIVKIVNYSEKNTKSMIYDLIRNIKLKYVKSTIEDNGEKIFLYDDDFKYLFFVEDDNTINIQVISHKNKIVFENFKIIEDEFLNYIKKINIENAKKVVERINNSIKDNMWLDFMINDCRDNLHIIGSNDLSCYYDIEIVFKNVSFIECSSHFNTCPSEYNVFEVDEGYKDNNIKININPDTSSYKRFYIICEDIDYNNEMVRYDYNYTSLYSNDKENIIKKYGLIKENNSWYQNKENSHRALIFTDKFFNSNDTIGIIFRLYKLCFAKVKYFRTFYYKFEYYKYDYKLGFVKTDLWDVEFFKHIDSGFMIDLRYLQSITVYEDFLKFCEELDSYSDY